MARAAEDAVWWASFQSKLGIAGFIAVLLSLIFTGWAAWAAARAAKTAQDSIKAASQTAERQLRAYVGIETGGVLLRNGGVHPYVKFKNFGVTPAYKLRSWMMTSSASDGDAVFPEDRFTSDSTIGPGSNFVMEKWVEMTPVQIQAIKDAAHSAYIWGRVEYVDAFKQPRWLTFKAKMNGPTGRIVDGPTSGVGWGFTPSPDGNDEN